jgi:hypothetical protein
LACHVAVAGSDYTALQSVDLDFNTSFDVQCVDISINDDWEQEETETIVVEIVETNYYYGSFSDTYQETRNISIMDNDG